MERLRGKDLLLVGLTLFSMFFGAGNLIFPPYVGAQAGVNTWLAMVGMAVSAVGLPVLGVVAVAKAGGLDVMGDRIHPLFSRVFTVACYLAIGPCLAIPRTASTSFEMAVIPFAGAQAPLRLFQWAYTLVFFALALWVALKPEKLTDRFCSVIAFGTARRAEGDEKAEGLWALGTKYAPGLDAVISDEIATTAHRTEVIAIDLESVTGKEGLELLRERGA